MKVLSIGSDRKLFDENSSVAGRMVSYGNEMEALYIIVFSLASNGFKEKKLSEKVTVYPTNSSSKLFYIWDAIRIGKRIVLEQKFIRGQSVITVQDPFESGWIGWRISKSFKIPLHIQIHTDFLSPFFADSFLQKMRVRISKFILPKSDYVRVVSKNISDSIKKSGIILKRDSRILPIRVDIEKLEKKEITYDLSVMFPQFKFIILMASRLTKEKCIDDAITAFSKVVKNKKYVGLVIAGDGPLKKELEDKVRELQIERNVFFIGWREDVFSLMKSASMFLSTSAYEGYGMSIIEAGLAKCPVLSTNVGITGDILIHNKNSYICPVNDIMCLYEGIEALISNNGLRYSFAQFLESDVASTIPSKDEYTHKYVSLLEEASHI